MASRGRGGNLKGGNFERKIAKLLTKWWNESGLEGEFYRTPASGGLRWQKRDDTIGDICTPEGFIATIECKNSESWSYSELFTETIAKQPPIIKKGKNKGKHNSPRTIGEFWYQACDEAKRAGKIPILIFTQNYQKDLIVFPSYTKWISRITDEFEKWIVDKFFVFGEDNKKYCKTSIMRFDKFLEMTDSKEFLG